MGVTANLKVRKDVSVLFPLFVFPWASFAPLVLRRVNFWAQPAISPCDGRCVEESFFWAPSISTICLLTLTPTVLHARVAFFSVSFSLFSHPVLFFIEIRAQPWPTLVFSLCKSRICCPPLSQGFFPDLAPINLPRLQIFMALRFPRRAFPREKCPLPSLDRPFFRDNISSLAFTLTPSS